ncbi:hypothetical protein KM1_293980 [Entamoeba histolytica HM-3:IMSS]|uniref:CRESS-DNA virus Rep endonuclease domain-containing protein n=2 Tax=Entamoeba histolytica TaxID=5759 RepID=M2RYB8_ENTHI|nr:Hypothetical protein EHI5A_163890 [Entamoeba histolytica KU27]EMS11643.1 hypothetical protein KM1_293980 [Entamoeba histolytica HM-3:IMSS]
MSSRRYQLTLNEPTKYYALLMYLKHYKSLKYLISCKEIAPTTSHVHIHIYAVFSCPVKLQVSKLQGAHIELCKGSNKANIDYIKKDGNILDELGEEPHQGLHSTVAELIEVKDPADLNPIELNRWIQAKNLNQRIDLNTYYKPAVKVFYVWGLSGIGKTKWVFDKINELNLQNCTDRVSFINNFWHGVSSDGQSTCAWYDDFRSTDMKPNEFIKFIDYYKNNLNVKNGNVVNNYLFIFITSVENPEELYKNMQLEEPRRQWLRRMEIIHLEDEPANSATESITELASTWPSVTLE